MAENIPNGRKFKLTLLTLFLATAGFAVTAVVPVLASVYSELVSGLIGILLVYAGGNVGAKFAGKGAKLPSDASQDGQVIEPSSLEKE